MNREMATIPVYSPDGPALLGVNKQLQVLKAPWLFIAMWAFKLCGIHLAMQPLHPTNHLTSPQTKFNSCFLLVSAGI
jgi:hypothetical protein